MSKLNRIDQQMVEEVLPTGTTSGTNPFDYGKVKAKRTEKKVYTQAELDEAIREEQDGCLEELECFMEHDICLFRSIEKAIRARGNNAENNTVLGL